MKRRRRRYTPTEKVAILKRHLVDREEVSAICEELKLHPNQFYDWQKQFFDWLAKNPRVTLHFTPTSGSWLNLVEVFFGIVTRQAIRRGSFDSVKQLVTAISTFIDGWNERCHPFIWTKTPDEILDRIDRKRKHVSATRH